MQFVRASREKAISQITGQVNEALKKGSVLLLLSGGSNISLGVEVVQKLNENENLTVGLIDERFGPVGHTDSNWQKLLDAGLQTKGVETLPVLKEGLSFSETSAKYSQELEEVTRENQAVIGIFGMGADGHTSGILPSSPAVDSQDIFTHYSGPDFERLTTTPAYFKSVDTAILVAYGDNKRPMLEKLKRDESISTQPAQALKSARQLIVYNDQMD